MNFKIVTTFLDKPLKGSSVNKELLNPKARRHWYKNSDETISRGMKFVEQASKLLPDNVSLRVYYEGDDIPEDRDNVEFIPHDISKVEQFKRKADGKVIPKTFEKYDYNDWKKRINFASGYDYEFDAIRFCHPPFALIEAHNTIEERYLISIDADVEIHEKIPNGFFESLVKDDCYTSYLSRRPHKHMESAFIVWDTEHTAHTDWWKEYKLLYEDNKLFDIYDGWTDCHAFEYVNDKINKRYNINSNIIALHQSHNVWEVSPLQKYMSHYKGTAIPV